MADPKQQLLTALEAAGTVGGAATSLASEMLVGGEFDDATVLQAASALEKCVSESDGEAL